MDQSDRRHGDQGGNGDVPDRFDDPLETEGADGAETPGAGGSRRRRNQEKRVRRVARRDARAGGAGADGDAEAGTDGAAAGGRAAGGRASARAARKAARAAGQDGEAQDAAATGAVMSPAQAKAARRATRQARRSTPEPETADAGAPRAGSIVVDVQSEAIARRARRRRFWGRFWLWLSFLVMVAAPTGVATWYLNFAAADQYASETSFAVRSLHGSLPAPITEFLGGGGGDSTIGDSEMLYEYLQSQPMVEKVQADVDLVAVYNRPEGDWLFSLGLGRTIEEMVDYWNRAVTVSYDTGSGIIYVETRAFRAEDAQAVAEAVLEESERLINSLSTGARADAVRFAEVDLVEAEGRVREARVALQTFRAEQGTADVSSDISQQMSLIGQLRSQRSEAQADYDSRKGLLGANSPVLSALKRRITSLDSQIAAEEARIAAAPAAAAGAGQAATSVADPARPTLAEAAGEQERLQVDLELATRMYTAAQASLETARAEARRAQRYLATHIRPTLSEEAEYPRRIIWSLAAFGSLLLTWAIMLLIVSSIRDRN